jgi:hypothetical protein
MAAAPKLQMCCWCVCLSVLVCRSRHHLVVVGAQECNYTKDARNSRRRGEKQEQRAFSMNAANGAGAAAAAAAAAEPADSGGEQGIFCCCLVVGPALFPGVASA